MAVAIGRTMRGRKKEREKRRFLKNRRWFEGGKIELKTFLKYFTATASQNTLPIRN